MRRAAIEKFRTQRVWREHLASHGATVLCSCDLEPGRFRKSQRVGGCGRPRCWLCHYDKLAGVPTAQDLRAFASERGGLVEVLAANNALLTDTYASPLRARRGAAKRER